jgi:hypothetical protein
MISRIQFPWFQGSGEQASVVVKFTQIYSWDRIGLEFTQIIPNGDGSKPWYLVNPKIAGKWMFIPLKCIYRYWPIPKCTSWNPKSFLPLTRRGTFTKFPVSTSVTGQKFESSALASACAEDAEGSPSHHRFQYYIISMDWFKGKFTGKPHI